ncbi:MAG: cytochrome c [Deltaproteobacteria bacterium]|nr:cytochrome c [Deltaproteobacteria bacterium]
MKKIIALLSAAFFALTVLAFAADELRPSQKLMRERAAWMAAMNDNFKAKQFPPIVKAAEALAAQTAKSGEGLTDPSAKALTLSIAQLAAELAAAAAKSDGATIQTKLAEIKGKCDACHGKFRIKK